jgi:hypothetical protein
MLRHGPFRTAVFPSVLQAACPEFEPSRPVRSRADIAKLKKGEIGWFDGDLIESVANSAEDRRRQYTPLRSCVDVVAEWLPSPESLLKAIGALEPDVLHSLELQHGAYLCLEADRRKPGVFPPWIASNWGSDVYLYRKLSAHRPMLESLFGRIDGFQSDCERDVGLAKELGFRGVAFPAMPAAGGIDLMAYPDPARLPPPSKRRMILVKGYHGWAGRGLHILLAIHRIAPKLKDYEIRVTHCGSPMRDGG